MLQKRIQSANDVSDEDTTPSDPPAKYPTFSWHTVGQAVGGGGGPIGGDLLRILIGGLRGGEGLGKAQAERRPLLIP